MSNRNLGSSSDSDGSEVRFRFRLYVAGEAPNSIAALANLERLCDRYFRDRSEIEVVDILAESGRALSDGVLVTPMLIRLSPPPTVRIIGDLSDTGIVLVALGAAEVEDG